MQGEKVNVTMEPFEIEKYVFDTRRDLTRLLLSLRDIPYVLRACVIARAIDINPFGTGYVCQCVVLLLSWPEASFYYCWESLSRR